MAYAKMAPRRFAVLIKNGRKQLDELPRGIRASVQDQLDLLNAESDAPSVDSTLDDAVTVTMDNTKAEIMNALDVAGIEYNSKAKKADLLLLFP